MKKFILKIKLNFIKKNAPSMVTHWNENKSEFTFFAINENPVVIKKTLLIKFIDFLAYKVMK